MAHSSFYRQPDTANIPPLALRSAEAARSLGLSLSTLERLTRSGDIPSVLIGRCRVYEVETLREYLRDRREKGGAA